MPSETLIRHAKYLVYSGGAEEMCAIQQAGDYIDRFAVAFAVYLIFHDTKIEFL